MRDSGEAGVSHSPGISGDHQHASSINLMEEPLPSPVDVTHQAPREANCAVCVPTDLRCGPGSQLHGPASFQRTPLALMVSLVTPQ